MRHVRKHVVDTVKFTTVGRLIFNQILPSRLKYTDKYLVGKSATLNKGGVSGVVSDVYETHGKEATINFLDELKAIGFKYAMKGGITIAMTDMDVPGKRDEIINKAEDEVRRTNKQYDRGTLSAGRSASRKC